MKQKTALKAVLYISAAGILFSGYLSFYELTRSSCPVGGCSNLLGLPVCVYGLLMYTAILVITLIGLRADK